MNKELKFIHTIKSQHTERLDYNKELFTINGIEHPFIVSEKNEDIGCLFLNHDGCAKEPEVCIMYIKSYNPKKGHGSKILNSICRQADKYNIQLYVEPVADDEDTNISLHKLTSWYQSFGFVGHIIMVRPPNA